MEETKFLHPDVSAGELELQHLKATALTATFSSADSIKMAAMIEASALAAATP